MAYTSYSQNFEDVYIHRAFRDVDQGFYIDVGAYHPDDDSVTRFFYDRGWRGINVEPGPTFDLFAQRERDINLRVAMAGTSGSRTFYYHEGDPGTSTLMPDLSPDMAARVGDRRAEKVSCVTLEELISEHAPGQHVHFLKLDIEGEEQSVIESVDWHRYRPELLVIESTLPYTNTRRDDVWSAALVAGGYKEVFFDGVNTYHLREESLFRRHGFDRPVNVLDGFQRYRPELDSLRSRVALLEAQQRDRAAADSLTGVEGGQSKSPETL